MCLYKILHVPRQFRKNFDRFTRDRVPPAQLAGMQSQSTKIHIEIPSQRIEPLAKERMSDLAEMDANLIGAAGLWKNIRDGKSSFDRLNPILGNRRFGFGILGKFFLMKIADRHRNLTAGMRQAALDKGDIFLFYLAHPKLLHHHLLIMSSLRENDRSRRIAIDPMARIKRGLFLFTKLEIGNVDQGTFFSFGGRND